MRGLTLTVENADGTSRLAGPLPAGDAGTEATIAAMSAVIADAREYPIVRQFAREIEAWPSGTVPGELFVWLRYRTKFHKDPPGVEFLRHPVRVLAAAQAAAAAPAGEEEPLMDCDDRAMLAAAVLGLCGYRVALIVAGRDPAGPFEHVYAGFQAEAGAPAGGRMAPGWIAFDPQETPAVGSEIKAARRRVYAL